MLNEGLRTLGSNCAYDEGVFKECRIEEITLPRTLGLVGNLTFSSCYSLKVIYVEDGCEANLTEIKLQTTTRVGPPQTTMIGNARIWNQR